MSGTPSLFEQFREALVDCKNLYLSSAQYCITQYPALLPDGPQEFLQLMADLHRGLLVKVYASVAEADSRWSGNEQQLAQILIQHLWHQKLAGPALREAARHLFTEGMSLQWYSLVQPFERIAPLRERAAELETIVVRLGNLVAKVDGEATSSEVTVLTSIEEELTRHLRPLPLDAPRRTDERARRDRHAVEELIQESGQSHAGPQPEKANQAELTVASPEERLEEGLNELETLVGLADVKQEVRTLINYLAMQRQRREASLPTTELSLHMVFGGNPGTGKTTVARIIGEIYGAMGVLAKGHLVETDRSGLVAEFAGQTGPKTNKKIDEALDGVLFIDEAYSLVDATSEDAFGREAVQTLLKRMEDNRDRLVVILAGYPGPMENLLTSNPGLSSRFNTKLAFADYSTGELARIFQTLCHRNHYVAPPDVLRKLLLAFQWLYETRDEHFGNGRLVRNTFETAIRRLANRIAGIAPVTRELLTLLSSEDFEFPDVPDAVWQRLQDDSARYHVGCSQCQAASAVPADYLGRPVKCSRCEHRFVAAWGEPCQHLISGHSSPRTPADR